MKKPTSEDPLSRTRRDGRRSIGFAGNRARRARIARGAYAMADAEWGEQPGTPFPPFEISNP